MLGRLYKCPGDLQTLPLPSGEVAAVLLHSAVDPAGAPGDDLVQGGVLQGGDDGVVRDRRVPQRHVVPHSALEEEDVLVDEGDRGGQRTAGNVLQTLSVHPDRALHGL